MRRARWCLLIALAACKSESKPAEPAKAPAPPARAHSHSHGYDKHAEAPAEAHDEPSLSEASVTPVEGVPTLAAYNEQSGQLVDKLAAVFTASGTNCDVLAANLEAYYAQNKATLDATARFEVANPEAEEEAAEALVPKQQAFIQAATDAVQACTDHARAKAAMEKLQ